MPSAWTRASRKTGTEETVAPAKCFEGCGIASFQYFEALIASEDVDC